MPTQARPPGSGNVLRLLKNPAVALGMLAVGTFLMGQFALFTYHSAFVASAIVLLIAAFLTLISASSPAPRAAQGEMP